MALEFIGSPVMQMVFWGLATIMAFWFIRLIKGAELYWVLIGAGILIYGIRVSYKLLPFYETTQEIRFILGIIGGTLFLIGVVFYYSNVLCRLISMEGA